MADFLFPDLDLGRYLSTGQGASAAPPNPWSAGAPSATAPQAGALQGTMRDAAMFKLNPNGQPAYSVPRGYFERTIPTMANWARGIGGILSGGAQTLGRYGARALPGVGAAVGVGAEAMDVAKVAQDPNASGIDVATQVARGTSKLASSAAGAGLGFASPIPGGALIGGTLGYFAPELLYKGIDFLTGRNDAPKLGAKPGLGISPADDARERAKMESNARMSPQWTADANAMRAQAAADAADPTGAVMRGQQANSIRADEILAGVTRQVGRGPDYSGPVERPRPEMPFGERVSGFNDADRINQRIRNLVGSDTALAGFNEAQRLNRSGITASRDANGRLSLSGTAGGKQYTAADGTLTTDWTKTENYQSAIARNAADKAALGKIEDERKIEEGLGMVKRATTGADRATATELLKSEMNRQALMRTAALNAAVEGRKASTDAQRLFIDAITAQTNVGKTNLEATKLAGLLQAAQEARARGASPNEIATILGGGDTTPQYREAQNVIPSVDPMAPKLVLNSKTGAYEMRTPQTRATVARGSDGKTYVMGPNGQPLREASPDEIRRARGG